MNVNVAEGYSTGEVQKAIKEVAAQVLPSGYGYEYGGMAREEASSGGAQTVFIYTLCVVLIYLILSCLYESFLVPLAVILSVPFGLMGSFLFARVAGTVLCMIFGMLPLMFSSGAGANGNSSLATGVVGGMLIGTLALLFVVPVFFVVFEYLQEKLRGPMQKEPDQQILYEKEQTLIEKSAFNTEK